MSMISRAYEPTNHKTNYPRTLIPLTNQGLRHQDCGSLAIRCFPPRPLFIGISFAYISRDPLEYDKICKIVSFHFKSSPALWKPEKYEK